MDLLKYFWELLMNFIKKAMFDKTFTKQKFLSLKKTQQHKKISSLLKEIYQNLLSKKDISNLLDYYQKLCSYLKIDPITKIDLQVVSEKYHFHLKEANISLKEHNLLPLIKKGVLYIIEDAKQVEELKNLAVSLGYKAQYYKFSEEHERDTLVVINK